MQEHITTEVFLFSAMTRYLAGTDSVEKLQVKWLSLVSTCIIVVQRRQAGLMEPIRPWLMGLFSVKCVLGTLAAAVIIQLTSASATVEGSAFTDLSPHLIVIYATVAMDYHKHQVGRRNTVTFQPYLVLPRHNPSLFANMRLHRVFIIIFF